MGEEECVYVARKEKYEFVTDKLDKLEAHKQKFHILHEHIAKQKKKMETMRKKMEIRNGGYLKIGNGLNMKDGKLRNKLIEMEDELEIYQELKEKEERIIPQRIKKWERLIKIEK